MRHDMIWCDSTECQSFSHQHIEVQPACHQVSHDVCMLWCTIRSNAWALIPLSHRITSHWNTAVLAWHWVCVVKKWTLSPLHIFLALPSPCLPASPLHLFHFSSSNSSSWISSHSYSPPYLPSLLSARLLHTSFSSGRITSHLMCAFFYSLSKNIIGMF